MRSNTSCLTISDKLILYHSRVLCIPSFFCAVIFTGQVEELDIPII